MATSPKVSRIQLGTYGLMAIPVAAAGLPIYVHLPKWYADEFGIGLGILGMLLLAVRLFDTVQDPLIGSISDRLVQKGMSRRRLIAYALPLLALGFLALGFPLDKTEPVLWLTLSLIFTYTAYSFVSINYYALGAEMDSDYAQRSRISTWRELFIIIGLIFGIAIPSFAGGQAEEGLPLLMGILAVSCIALAFMGRFFLLKPSAPVCDSEPKSALKAMVCNPQMRWWSGLMFINGLANAIPPTLILFFIQDVLRAPEHEGYFLLIYVAMGLVGAPFWLWMAKRTSKRNTLMISMALACLAFTGSAFLGTGDVLAFYIICGATGFCLIADLAMPPAMLSDISGEESGRAGSYFSVWNILWKLTFALSAGLTFPVLAYFGYNSQSGANEASALLVLTLGYGLVPPLLKITAIILLWLSPLDKPAQMKGALS